MEANVPLATLTGKSRDNFSVEFSLVTGLWLQNHKRVDTRGRLESDFTASYNFKVFPFVA